MITVIKSIVTIITRITLKIIIEAVPILDEYFASTGISSALLRSSKLDKISFGFLNFSICNQPTYTIWDSWFPVTRSIASGYNKTNI